MPHQMTPDAVALLETLREGGNFSEPTASYDSFAYSAHALVFFSNAARLCEDDGMSDFRVYGALYCLRHGLELMLKCICRNDSVDDMLRTIMHPGYTFSDVCNQLKLDKKRKGALLRSICVIRNVLEDGLQNPRCHRENIGEDAAERALDYFRKNPTIPRDRFTLVWSFATPGHDLLELWTKAAPIIESFTSDARRCAQEIGYPQPLDLASLRAVIELLAAMDDGGDGFRYPSSLSGDWYLETPRLSLNALHDLVQSVKSTCEVFENVREECYSMATFRNPTPQYSASL